MQATALMVFGNLNVSDQIWKSTQMVGEEISTKVVVIQLDLRLIDKLQITDYRIIFQLINQNKIQPSNSKCDGY